MPLSESTKFTLRQMGPVRGIKTWLKVNKKDGFDCQSCAWPSPDQHRHLFEFCENGVKAFASEATKKTSPRNFSASTRSPNCWREAILARTTGPARGAHGQARRRHALQADLVGRCIRTARRELKALPSPDAAAFYTSGRTSNEAAFLYQLFVRQFGTNNLPDCSNMCHESSGAALNETIGIGKGCVTLDDFERCDGIFILGQNPGTNHPRMLTSLSARSGTAQKSSRSIRCPSRD